MKPPAREHVRDDAPVMRPRVSRDRMLTAAARVYGRHGFRGATTRRIAAASGLAEVTLFRHFGSKVALLQEAICSRIARAAPAAPVRRRYWRR